MSTLCRSLGWRRCHGTHALLLHAGASNRELMSQAVLLEHHNRQCDHDTEVLNFTLSPHMS